MNLSNLYQMIKEKKHNLRQAKELQSKFLDMVNPKAIEYEEYYLKCLIKQYKEMGGKRNVEI